MRLIDADALIADCNIYNAWDAQIVKDVVKAWIDDQPTIDAEPVRHGYWEYPDFYDFGSVCSYCGFDSGEIVGGNQLKCLKYCPNCGAKMDGVSGCI